MSEEVKPEAIKREHKFARVAFSIGVTVLVGLAAFEAINWLAHLRH
jgi:hypothetical protein